MKKNSLLVILVIAFISCKTQEDIRRERSMDNINEKINQTQAISASSSIRFQNLEEQIAKLNGTIEELNYEKTQNQKEGQLLKDKMKELESLSKAQNENIKLLAEKVNEQSKYIDQVVKYFDDLAEKKPEESKKKIEKNSDEEKESSSVKAALSLYKTNKLADAKNMFEDLLENKKIKKKDKPQILFYLGMIEYKNKKYEDSKIYFSRLYTENPESSYSAGALLNLAKSFAQLKSKDEARETLDELITRFPKSKEATEAAKLKMKL